MNKQKEIIEKSEELIDGVTMDSLLQLKIYRELMAYSGEQEEGPILDVDIKKFYEYFYDEFFKKIIEKNSNRTGLSKNVVKFACNTIFMSTIAHINLYDVEKLRFLELCKSFIQDYENYLNDKE